jgi:hypothetical protein
LRCARRRANIEAKVDRAITKNLCETYDGWETNTFAQKKLWGLQVKKGLNGKMEAAETV